MQQTGVQRWGFTLLSQPWFLGIWRVFPGPKVMLPTGAGGPWPHRAAPAQGLQEGVSMVGGGR